MAIIHFFPMSSINKKTSMREQDCSDWVATEKVHGSSFQFYTNDGETVHLASRRQPLDNKVSFLKCNLEEFRQRHFEFVSKMFASIVKDDRWRRYRTMTDMITDDDEEVEDAADDEEQNEGDNLDENKDGCASGNETQDIRDAGNGQEIVELRIYGELYGGGGISKDLKSAVQKEIIYSDEFRFYVFGININRKWATVMEMNDLCRDAGFPYYAVPVCEPRQTLEDLTAWLTSNGFMASRSRLTDKTDDVKTKIEGVVMTPLCRNDFRFHAIKLLSVAFNDVRVSVQGQTKKVNYCTKARYNSVISKLDIHERENTDLVTDMFIADIVKEAGQQEVTDSKKNGWTKAVRGWQRMDGYIRDERKPAKDDEGVKSKRERKSATKEQVGNQSEEQTTEQDDEDVGENGFGGLFG